MVSATTVLRWSQRTCRLTLFVSDSCRGRYYGGNGIGSRSSGVTAMETEAVERSSNGNRGSGGGNIEAVERWRRWRQKDQGQRSRQWRQWQWRR
jgi:hypothetical protein